MAKGKKKPESPKKGNGLPILAVAVLCERVLTEKDHVVSLMRLVDVLTINIPLTEKEEITKPSNLIATGLVLYFQLRAGECREDTITEFWITSPDGVRELYAKAKIEFSKCTTAGSVLNGTIPLQLKWKGNGVYSIDFVIKDTVMSTIIFTASANYLENEKGEKR